MTCITSEILLVSPSPQFGSRLLPVARRIFSETFSGYYDREVFEAYCDKTYAVDGPMAKDLADPSIQWRAAVVDGEPIGYAKLTPLRAPAPKAKDGALELQQIYVLSSWHGKGVAEQLMHWAIEAAREASAPELYLTVFDRNERAKRFYTRHGFIEVGHCTFTLGDRVEDDRVWCKSLVA